MSQLKRFATALFLSLTVGLVSLPSAHAEQMKVLGDWNVHYMALGSTFLTPDIAKAYGLKRSNYSGIVNISVLSSKAGNPAQKVEISGQARNLLGNTVDLNFKEIVEGKAVYYIAEIDYSNEETFKFDIRLQQGKQSQRLQFSQTFYTN